MADTYVGRAHRTYIRSIFSDVCPLYRDIRKQYLTSYYCSWPTINKCETLLSKQNKNGTTNLSKYIYHAMNIRNLLDN